MRADEEGLEPSTKKLARCPFWKVDSKWRTLLTTARIEVVLAATDEKTATSLQLTNGEFNRNVTVCANGQVDNDVASLKYSLLVLHLAEGVPNARWLTISF
jgi:hypothetical protein